jgi:hypothetical protein
MSIEKSFVYGSLVDEINFCNYQKEADRLIKGCLKGKRFVIYGRRNFGKTSLVRNIVGQKFLKIGESKKRKPMVIYMNFLGSQSKNDLDREVRLAFTRSFSQCFPVLEAISTVKKFFLGLRPVMSVDPLTGEPSFSLSSLDHQTEISFEDILERLGQMARNGASQPLLIMDEFQDIHFVPGAEAKMREALESLPSEVAVIVLGSKKHILANIFARPDSPLCGWGEDVEMGIIEEEVYRAYANERLHPYGLNLSESVSSFLQRRLDYVPEAMNIMGSQLIEHFGEKGTRKKPRDLTIEDVGVSLLSFIDMRSDRFKQYLVTFSESELKVLHAIATEEVVKAPQSRTFADKVAGVSMSGIKKIFKKLEDHAIIYMVPTRGGYTLSDPLLAEYLRRN